jgi:siroheme synthase (precorrin-2 oxidase/ferrochelatase)
LQIGVSTNGGGPRLGARIRDSIVRNLDPETPASVIAISRMRGKFRKVDEDMNLSGPMVIESRGKWISKFCDTVINSIIV